MQNSYTIDLNTPLGRTVITPQQVLEVIRPQLRAARYLQRGIALASREGWLQEQDGGDSFVEELLNSTLLQSAFDSVKTFAFDMELIFQGDATREFIHGALAESAYVSEGDAEVIPGIGLEY